jgi:hypothetical protein
MTTRRSQTNRATTKRAGKKAPAKSDALQLTELVFSTVGKHLTIAPAIYAAVQQAATGPAPTKSDIDEALGVLYKTRRVILHEHTMPRDPDRPRMIHFDGKVFVGANRRDPS